MEYYHWTSIPSYISGQISLISQIFVELNLIWLDKTNCYFPFISSTYLSILIPQGLVPVLRIVFIVGDKYFDISAILMCLCLLCYEKLIVDYLR